MAELGQNDASSHPKARPESNTCSVSAEHGRRSAGVGGAFDAEFVDEMHEGRVFPATGSWVTEHVGGGKASDASANDHGVVDRRAGLEDGVNIGGIHRLEFSSGPHFPSHDPRQLDACDIGGGVARQPSERISWTLMRVLTLVSEGRVVP